MTKYSDRFTAGSTVVIDPRIFSDVGPWPLIALKDVHIVIPLQLLGWTKPSSHSRDGIANIRLASAKSFIENVRRTSPDDLRDDNRIDESGTTLRLYRTTSRSTATRPSDESFSRLLKTISRDLAQKRRDNGDDGDIMVISNDLVTRLEVQDTKKGIVALPHPKPPTELPTNCFVVKVDRSTDGETKLNAVLEQIKRQCKKLGIEIPRRATAVIPWQRSDNGGFAADMFVKEGYDISQIYSNNVKANKVDPAHDSKSAKGARGNYEQTFALYSLLDNTIDIVALGGTPGGGKSFLALAAALALCKDKSTKFDHIIVFRSVVPVGGDDEDLGFLPGDQDEKLAKVAEPVYANMAQIFKINCRKNDDSVTLSDAMDTAKADPDYGKKLSVEPLRNIRGVTLDNAIVILDDAQNVKLRTFTDLMARPGKNSRLFITYDVQQNDTGDSLDNGIMPVLCELERMQQLPDPPVRFAHHKFTTSQRHAMAELAEMFQANFVAYGTPVSPTTY